MNQMHGKGRMEEAGGTVYKGEFAQGHKEGFGECTWSNGDHYAGYWHHNKPHGKGKWTSVGGSVKEGIWLHGKIKEVSKVDVKRP